MRTSLLIDRFCQALAVCLMLYLHVSSISYIISIGAQPLVTNPGYFLLCNGLMFMVYVNYFLSSFVDPGSPSMYLHCGGETSLPICRICRKEKPPRSHHCSSCRKCVLAMDHHCPWIGGCVGFFNYSFFVRFLVFTILASASLFVLNAKILMVLSFSQQLDPYMLQPVLVSLVFKEIYKRQMMLLFNCIILSIVFISISILLIQHFINIYGGRTYIESLEQETLADFIYSIFQQKDRLSPDEKLSILDLQQNSRFPYDLGLKGNIESIFGHPSSPLLLSLFCCFPRANGDGVHFKNNRGLEGFIKWPPAIRPTYADDDEEDGVYRST